MWPNVPLQQNQTFPTNTLRLLDSQLRHWSSPNNRQYISKTFLKTYPTCNHISYPSIVVHLQTLISGLCTLSLFAIHNTSPTVNLNSVYAESKTSVQNRVGCIGKVVTKNSLINCSLETQQINLHLRIKTRTWCPTANFGDSVNIINFGRTIFCVTLNECNRKRVATDQQILNQWFWPKQLE